MNKVLIIGAGSIGNHLAYACRQKNLHVSIYDIDEPALLRTKKMIYPSRYGEWDTQIKLLNEFPQTEKYNIVIIGTPPDSHLSIASKVLQEIKPNVILIEKPLCPPGMKGLETLKGIRAKSNTTVLVGYNHNLTANTKFVENLLDEVFLGIPLSMHVRWLEYWGGIFEAHPWLDGPKDSYLGFSERGGGACAEHSHAVSIWQHFSNYMNCGNIKEVSAVMNIFNRNELNYDESTIISVKSENGLVGSIVQDVVTVPSQKNLRIQGDKGFVEWYVNYDSEHDAVIYGKIGKNSKTKLIPKTRPDDFAGEIRHIDELINNPSNKSPISFELGIECMKVIKSAFQSNLTGEKVIIE